MDSLSDDEAEFRDVGSLCFDTIIGYIEDIIISEEFAEMRDNFFNQYCSLFDCGEENKLIYTEIFNKYTQMVEHFLTAQLELKVPDFKMDHFMEDLKQRADSLNGEVFEMLAIQSDFLSFKEMVLDFKLVKEGLVTNLTVNGTQLKM